MKLLEPIQIGNASLNNSMAMAPMTRSRANIQGVVGTSTVLYYTQRAWKKVTQAVHEIRHVVFSKSRFAKTI